MTYSTQRQEPNPVAIIVATIGIIVGIVSLLIGLWWGFSAFHRWNSIQGTKNAATRARIQAANQTAVNSLLIGATNQQVQIHQAQAQVRLADAVGIKEAQDEISKTLTPLYVQFEMVEALKEIAVSGKNNTVEFIPSGANGIPLVSNVQQGPVTAP